MGYRNPSCIPWRYLMVRDDVEDLGVDGRQILKWIFEKLNCSMDWIDLVQDRDRWRALVTAVMNSQVPKMRGIS
jgi:hypothetical protein